MQENQKPQQNQERAEQLMEKLVMATTERKSGALNEILFDTLNYFIRRALRRILRVDDLQLNDMLAERMKKKK